MIGPITKEVVYFSCPKSFQHSEAYAAVMGQLRQHHPNATVLEPAVIWQEFDWLTTYQRVLAPVTHYYLVVPPDGLVGRGCYTEWEYFQGRGIVATAFSAQGVFPVGTLVIVNGDQDWVQYALVVPASGSEEKGETDASHRQ